MLRLSQSSVWCLWVKSQLVFMRHTTAQRVCRIALVTTLGQLMHLDRCRCQIRISLQLLLLGWRCKISIWYSKQVELSWGLLSGTEATCSLQLSNSFVISVAEGTAIHIVRGCRGLRLVEWVILQAWNDVFMLYFLLEKLVFSADCIVGQVGTAIDAFHLHLRLQAWFVLDDATDVLWCERCVEGILFLSTKWLIGFESAWH